MSDKIQNTVREKYGATAVSGLSSHRDDVRAVAEAFGYSKQELGSIPAEANMGLSCGNPTAFASLRAGETVVDLGCGGGLDVFLAAQKVGPTGKAIGIDMTPQMIELAKKNAAQSRTGNVAFHLASIDKLPLPDASVDVVISNCVINLAPDKPAVFREIARVLKPGGRVAVSDIALKQPLPEEIAQDVMAYVGCIAGAVLIDDYRHGLAAAGFAQVDVVDSNADLNAYMNVEGQAACCAPAATSSTGLPIATAGGCCGAGAASSSAGAAGSSAGAGTVHDDLGALLQKHDVNAYAASVKVYAVKPQ